uniref:Uncharacterized protein AlNc14C186G8333 n=1 Tax=Albugo laibachii Nc14 TaxID=890382 RepID=F0WPI8_9STRA|nr:conserved hypothetical protein [Albugo laibachii Nc14]|eukprot:CCA23236.1 conserved hypothetical protein [Albugo laibachii Nc14]
MNFFGFRSSHTSRDQVLSTNELDTLRRRQIRGLLRLGCRPLNKQQNSFIVHVADTARGRLDLIITLPPQFPAHPPIVQATVPLKHQWLSASGAVTSHPRLDQWIAHSDLSTIISEIHGDLRCAGSNEVVNSTVDSGMGSAMATVDFHLKDSRSVDDSVSLHSESGEVNATQLNTSSCAEHTRHVQMPCIPTDFPQLDSLSWSELERLTSDDEALSNIVGELVPVQNFRYAREEIMEANIKAAKHSLENETRMKLLQAKIRHSRRDISLSQKRFSDKCSRQREVYSCNNPDTLLNRVSNSMKESEMGSDQLAQLFVDGNLPVHDFLSQYLLIRKEYQILNLKCKLLK